VDKLEQAVGVEGRDLEQLLVQFLGEVIYLFGQVFPGGQLNDHREVGRRLPPQAIFRAMTGGAVRPFGHVKAVTYNEMRIDLGCPVTVGRR
jgi:SHS2 domain-containing protein